MQTSRSGLGSTESAPIPSVQLPIGEIRGLVDRESVGLLTNASFWLPEAGDDLAGLVRRSCRRMVLLFGEHGYRGDGGAGVAPDSSATHSSYEGVEARDIYALYQEGVEAGARLLADLDLVVIGVPDIGCRHYSYKTSMCMVMEAAARCGKPVVVVDFPNPVRGDIVEGNLNDPEYVRHFKEVVLATRGWEFRPNYIWCAAPLTYRHGMTVGELALWARDALQLDLELHVVKLHGWRRSMWWDDTGRPWLPLDPSIYSPQTALGFLCTGLFQGTTVAWGIGTAEPFCVLGAPWIKDDRLLDAMRSRRLAGVDFSRAFFVPRWRDESGPLVPTWGKYAGQECNGIRLHFTDRNAVQTAEVQLAFLVEFLRLYPDQFDFIGEGRFDCRLEDLQWPRRLKAGEGVETILAEWRRMARQFETMRKPYLLYS